MVPIVRIVFVLGGRAEAINIVMTQRLCAFAAWVSGLLSARYPGLTGADAKWDALRNCFERYWEDI